MWMVIDMRTLLWDFTERCNLKCLHCYNQSNVIKKHDTIYTDKNSDFLFEKFDELNVAHIHMLGGEPLFSKNALSFIKKAKSRKIMVSINTNGTLLDDYMINELLKLAVDQVVVSIDGIDAKTNDYIRGDGVYDIVIRNLENFVKKRNEYNANTLIQIATVVTAANADTIYKMPILAKKIGVDVINIMPVAMRGNAINNTNELELMPIEYYSVIKKFLYYSAIVGVKSQIDCKSRVLDTISENTGIQVEKNREFDKCMAGENIIYMNALGDIYPCGPLSMVASKYIVPVNIFENNLLSSVAQFKCQIRAHQNGVKIPTICMDCDRFDDCTHGQCSCASGPEICAVCNSKGC